MTSPMVNLRQFQYHTGAPIVPLAADEPCPPLFRDIGLDGVSRFLRGELTRLCGPLSPITYLRTAAYREPYVDHGQIGRLMLLAPRAVGPWHSGIEAVYVAPREIRIEPETMVFIPAEISLATAADRYADVRSRREFVEAMGVSLYQAMTIDSQERITELQQTHQETERLAAPLRQLFQSPAQRDRERAARWLEQAELSETDLCTAWHHLPRERREHIRASLREHPEAPRC